MVDARFYNEMQELLVENGLDAEYELRTEGDGVIIFHAGFRVCKIEWKAKEKAVYVAQPSVDKRTGALNGRMYYYQKSPSEVFDNILAKIVNNNKDGKNCSTSQEIQGARTIKRGDVFKGKNADLINLLFGKNYKAWMKSGYPCSYKGENAVVWMVRFDSNEEPDWFDSDEEFDREDIMFDSNTNFNSHTRSGWIDTMPDSNTIHEKYVWGNPPYDLNQVIKNSAYRYVFEKVDRDTKFIFKGLYKLNREKSSNVLRQYDLIEEVVRL